MEPCGVAVIVVAIVAGIAAIVSYAGSGDVYKSIGKGQFALDTEDRPKGPKPGSPAAMAEQAEEVRQMIQARSDRGAAAPPADTGGRRAARGGASARHRAQRAPDAPGRGPARRRDRGRSADA